MICDLWIVILFVSLMWFQKLESIWKKPLSIGFKYERGWYIYALQGIYDNEMVLIRRYWGSNRLKNTKIFNICICIF